MDIEREKFIIRQIGEKNDYDSEFKAARYAIRDTLGNLLNTLIRQYALPSCVDTLYPSGGLMVLTSLNPQ